MNLSDVFQVLRNLNKIEIEPVTLLLWAHYYDKPFTLKEIDLPMKEARLKELLGEMVKKGWMLRMGGSWMISTSGHSYSRGVLTYFL